MLKSIIRRPAAPWRGFPKRILRDVAAVNALSAETERLSDDGLREKRAGLQRRLDDGERIDGRIRQEAFALAREACFRVLGKRPYDVQIAGGLVMDAGAIAEMRTGEGKTLTAVMPSFLNALSGKGVHVVTVNDYLATRDAEQAGAVHAFLGLSVGVVLPGMDDDARKSAYACDVTYGTNSEFGFDHLRDNLRFDAAQMVQRGHHYAIVDEVDSVLIDEARTPLIISAPSSDASELCKAAAAAASRLERGRDCRVDEKLRIVSLEEHGLARAEGLFRSFGLLPAGSDLHSGSHDALVGHLDAALKARFLFARDRDYAVIDGKVAIIDANTGRMLVGRRFSDGVHQALEAKEGLAILPENETLSSITYQNYFRLYGKLAGMTGTAATEAEEFAEVYGLRVIAVPTNRPVLRVDEPDEVHLGEESKVRAVIDAIARAHGRGQPVLVGTASVEKSEKLAEALVADGFRRSDDGARTGGRSFRVLNANNHESEAGIIAEAGAPGAITVATNMAGRGTDIELGGAGGRERERVVAAGGLLVIGTERHESRRVDNQLRGRAGRQGDPGRSKFFVSLEDDVVRVFAAERMRKAAGRIGLRDGDAISHPLISRLIESAQKKVEARNYDVRKDVVLYDDVNDAQRKAMMAFRTELMSTAEARERTHAMREHSVRRAVARAIPPHSYPEQWDVARLEAELRELLGIGLPIADWAAEEGVAETELEDRVLAECRRAEATRTSGLPDEVLRHASKHALLTAFDGKWRDHLRNLEDLKRVIGYRTFAQRDPIVEYRTEAYRLFEAMIEAIEDETTRLASRIVPTRSGQ